MPIVMAVEQTVNEDFSDSTYQTGLTISGGGTNPAYIYTFENNQYGTTGNSLGITSGTYTFEFTEDVYEVGFVVGAVNYAWSIKWYYADGTDETVNKNAQNSGNLATMYETIYKSYTDYNAVENNTDKFITKFDVIVSDISLLDTLYWQYDDGLTAGIGDPSNLTTSANLHSGEISIDWDTATGYQYSAERYAIAFSDDNFQSTNYAVATGNVGGANALNTEYTFTKSYLEQVLSVTAGDTVYFKIRADNDTNSKYSNWTAVASYVIQDVAAGVTNLTIENTEYQGLKFTWTNPGTGWSSPTSYKIEYSDGDNTWNYDDEDVYSQNITDASLTTYNLESITAGTYWFSFYACTQNGSWCHGNQGTSPVQITVNATTPTTTTTVPAVLGPPMNVAVTQEYNVGVNVDWDEANTGTLTAETYELYFRTSAENETVVYNITETEYTIPYANIPNGDYTFSVRGYSSDDNAYSGFSTEPTLTAFNEKAQDDADAQAEADRIAREKAEAEERERKEAEERERQRLQKIEDEKNKNFNETGYYELDGERASREQAEYEAEQERIRLEEEEAERQRLQAIEDEKQANFAQTGYMELDTEREARELAEEQARIEEEIKNSINLSTDNSTSDGEPLTKEEEEKLEELVNVIIELQETLDTEEYQIEEEVFEIKEIIIVPTTTTTTTTTTIPIKEVIEEDEVLQEEPEFLEIEEEIVLTEEEIEVLVEETEEAINEVVEVEVLEDVFEEKSIEIIEEDELENLSVEEAEEYVEAVEEAVAEVVAELDTEELVEVVEQVASVDVQNLANADTQTKAVVKAVVEEVTKVETVEQLSEEEKVAVAEVLGIKDQETAAEDIEIIAKQAEKEPAVAEAVSEYVDRAIENKDVENYTLADVVTEVQVEVFLANPVGAIIDIDLENITLSDIGSDMSNDQKEKAQEVVVPVIIASQIIANAGALIRRPF